MSRNRRFSSFAVFCAAYATGGLGSFLGAADISWNNPAGGSFLSAENWNPAVIPGPNDRAIFNLGATYVLSSGVGSLMTVSNDRMLIGNDNVRFVMGPASASYSLTGTGDSVIVGDLSGQVATLSIGQGTTNVMGGVLRSKDAVVGNLPGSSGAVTMAGTNFFGTNADWTVDGTLYFGRGGHGSFSAFVRSSLRATNLVLGAEPGASGQFAAGPGAFVSIDVTQDVFVGGSVAGPGGTGGFSITGGGTVVDATFGGTFHVYENGVAKFDGARATTFNHLDVAGGKVEMVGMGSPRVNGDISVSNGGSLILALDTASTPDNLTIAGGKVTAATGLISYSGAGAIGAPAAGIAGQSPSIYNGTASFAGPLYLGGNASGPGGPGEYVGNVTASSVRLWPQGNFLGGYSITAPGGVINGGSIGSASLTSTGDVTTINGNYTQNNDGHLFIRLGTAAADQSDRLAITGSAALDGVLDLLLINPPSTDSFTILTAPGGVSGQWDNAIGTIAVDGFTYEVRYLPTSVQLALIPEPSVAAIATALIVSRYRRR